MEICPIGNASSYFAGHTYHDRPIPNPLLYNSFKGNVANSGCMESESCAIFKRLLAFSVYFFMQLSILATIYVYPLASSISYDSESSS